MLHGSVPTLQVICWTPPPRRNAISSEIRRAKFFFDPYELVYFAKRSERQGDPVFFWPQLVATAKSAMEMSSISPERCDITLAYPARLAISTAASRPRSRPSALS